MEEEAAPVHQEVPQESEHVIVTVIGKKSQKTDEYKDRIFKLDTTDECQHLHYYKFEYRGAGYFSSGERVITATREISFLDIVSFEIVPDIKQIYRIKLVIKNYSEDENAMDKTVMLKFHTEFQFKSWYKFMTEKVAREKQRVSYI